MKKLLCARNFSALDKYGTLCKERATKILPHGKVHTEHVPLFSYACWEAATCTVRPDSYIMVPFKLIRAGTQDQKT